MPTFLLRNCATSLAYPNHFDVILTMDDGYELRVGSISEAWGAGTDPFWQWGGPGTSGRECSREAAMAAFKAAWHSSDEDLKQMRTQQEWTDDKYALWDAGFRNLTIPLRCTCGEIFKASDREARRLHVPHLKTRSR